MTPLFTLFLVVAGSAIAMTLPAAEIKTGDRKEMVRLASVCPSIKIELRYATPHNGVGRAVYPKGARCLLRRGVADRLCRVQKRLEEEGYGLKVWDAYRPVAAQKALWEVLPDRRFVAPPRKGSKHNRGAAVDLTLVDANGREVPMPSDFDTFSVRAHPDYAGGTSQRRHNRDRLRHAMLAEGFKPDKNEWWHFNDPDWESYPPIELPLVSSGR